ncbi:protein FAM53B isoform X2 [Myxocyprinus asiaticus]|uniref:protein FAM53B isoform X2 n=1 Tax=Myxocyprinus asiaticus TaxID=70543 RepID=UPI0022234942|nr:protein FAM53B isoform X2 [Myxocyprinus asiaticus]
MCVAMVIIHTKTLDKKPVDDVTSQESLQLHEPPTMSQGTALFSCGIMDSGRWSEVSRGCGVQQRPVGSSLESLWDSVRETCSAREAGSASTISGLLRDLSLSEAPSPGSTAPPSKRQCRSLSCSDELSGCRSSWRPQGSRVWTSMEKRRCHSGGSVQRGVVSAFSPSGFPAIQRSSSFSLPTHTSLLQPFGHAFSFPASSGPPQTPYCSHEQICLPEPSAPSEASSPDSTPELERRECGLPRSRSQPCVHNDKKIGVKRRRPAEIHKQRPSLDLLKMTQLQDFHSLSCPGFTTSDRVPFSSPSLQHESDDTSEHLQLCTKDDTIINQSDASWTGGLSSGKECEHLWAGLCSVRGRDVFQLGGELDIEQIERN